MTFVIVGATLLLAGLLGVMRADGPPFVGACGMCGVGVAMLGWGLA